MDFSNDSTVACQSPARYCATPSVFQHKLCLGSDWTVLFASSSEALSEVAAVPVGKDPVAVVSADVNADGWLDLLTLSHGEGHVDVLLLIVLPTLCGGAGQMVNALDAIERAVQIFGSPQIPLGQLQERIGPIQVGGRRSADQHAHGMLRSQQLGHEFPSDETGSPQNEHSWFALGARWLCEA